MTGDSFWLRTSRPRSWRSLVGEVTADVAVIGAGIVGITTAFLLAQRGKRVVILDARRAASGVSGHTSAKVTVGHGLKYSRLLERRGEHTARVYADANQQALQWMRATVDRLGIECDWTESDSTIWAETDEQTADLEREAKAAQAVGLAAHMDQHLNLPFEIRAALVYPGQAHFHPLRYLYGLLDAASEGIDIYEHTAVQTVSRGTPHHVVTNHGGVTADQVVVATHFPILDRGLLFAQIHPYRKYVITGPTDRPLVGMHLSSGHPIRSVRPAWDGNEHLVVVSGEHHRTGSHGSTAARYAELESWARDRLGLTEIRDLWSSQDCYPVDDLPLIGPMESRDPSVVTATGFASWGITNGTAAARIIADHFTGVDNAFASTFSPARRAFRKAPRTTACENFTAAAQTVGDHARAWRTSVDEVESGEGKLAHIGTTPVAAYRDEDGNLHTLSARCTHLGCLVTFNSAQRTWDCPCHGSRFDILGNVLQGPATAPLPPGESPGAS